MQTDSSQRMKYQIKTTARKKGLPIDSPKKGKGAGYLKARIYALSHVSLPHTLVFLRIIR